MTNREKAKFRVPVDRVNKILAYPARGFLAHHSSDGDYYTLETVEYFLRDSVIKDLGLERFSAGQWKLLTEENFYKRSSGRFGFRPQCKESFLRVQRYRRKRRKSV